MKRRRTGIVIALLKGLVIAVVATLLGMLIMAAAVIFIGMGDGAIRIVNQILKIFAAALGTFIAVGRGGERGLITGACVGAVYAVAGYVLYICLGGAVFDAVELMGEMTICAAAGAVTGVVCANAKARSRAV
ncbi:MAG: TIGR04086 family membrane protein [Clostridia bacterium]|nr:TIGR04086 family membrane protein [Clostridia bacterium]